MALIFNGSSQYLSVSTAVATSPPIAVSCWYRAKNVTAVHMLLAITNNTTNQGFYLFANGQDPSDRLVAQAIDASGSPSATAFSSIGFTANVWQHVFAVFGSATDRRVWLNGGNQGSNSQSTTPAGLNTTTIAAMNTNSSFSLYANADLAEVSVWSGSGVELMGTSEAAPLAAGFSPLCLSSWLNRLVLYQPLIRDVNWPGVGPAMTAAGGPSAVAHPRAIYPASPVTGLFQFPPFVAPYRLAAAAAHANRVRQGWAAVAGPSAGDTYSIGEVSS